MIEELGFYSRQEKEMLLYSIQMRSKAKAASYPVGTRFVPGVMRYLGTTLTNQNSIAEEIKSRLKSGNACYHSVQNLLSSRLLSKNLKIKIYRTVILPVVLYGCETWSLTLWEERKLRVFENRVLRKIFGPRRDEVTGVCGYMDWIGLAQDRDRWQTLVSAVMNHETRGVS